MTCYQWYINIGACRCMGPDCDPAQLCREKYRECVLRQCGARPENLPEWLRRYL